MKCFFRGILVWGVILGSQLLGFGYCGPDIIYPEEEGENIKVVSNFPPEIISFLKHKQKSIKASEDQIVSLLTTNPIDFAFSPEETAGILIYWDSNKIAVPYTSHFFLVEHLRELFSENDTSVVVTFGKCVSSLEVYCHECLEIFENLDEIISEE